MTTGRDYLATYCPKATSAYNRIAPVAGKADIFRLCALLTEGGLYMDDDLFPLHPLEGSALVAQPPAAQ